MSDVWQGPGWWLASDGKWYPADAEPGAVYEGDLSNEPTTGDPAPGATPGPTATPDVPAVEPSPIVEADPPSAVMPSGVATPASESPVAPESSAVATPVVDVPDPAAPAPASFGADPFAQMPAPVVEEPKIGGWQSVTPDSPIVDEPPVSAPVAPAAEIPDPTPVAPSPAATVVDEDGWTSAFEEQQDGVDVNTPTISEPAIPEPTIATPIPEVQIPDVAAPTAGIPTEIPNVQIPDVTPPTAGIPTEIPNVQIPDVTPPTAGIPTEIPNVQIPDVTPPTAGIPTEIPEVPAPAASTPLVDPLVEGGAETTRPIERDDAWRKPLNADEATPRAAAAARPGVPDVVDLAIREDPAPYVPEPQGRNWGMILGLLVALAIICAIAFLIARAFTGDDDVATTELDGSTPITESDDSTTAPTTDSSEAPSTSDAEAATDTTENTDAGEEDGGVSVFALRAGDCIVGDIGAGQVTQVTKVDCEEEHQFEVYREALIESSITTFDEEAISAYAEEVCRTSLEAYIPPDDERGLKFKFLQPTEDSWNQTEDPDRVITCLLFDDDAPLIGRAN